MNYMGRIILNLWDLKKNFTNELDNNHAANYQAWYLHHGHILQPLTNPFPGSVKVVKVQAHSFGITKQSNLTRSNQREPLQNKTKTHHGGKPETYPELQLQSFHSYFLAKCS